MNRKRGFSPWVSLHSICQGAFWLALTADRNLNKLRPRPDGTFHVKDPLSPVLIDGRSRLGAIEIRYGSAQVIYRRKQGWVIEAGDFASDKVIVLDDDVDPYAFVLSANLHCRHMTAEDKRDLIAKLLRVMPDQSNRQIARIIGVSHVTVGAVRADVESTGQIDQLDKTIGKDGKARKPAEFTATSAAIPVAGGGDRWRRLTSVRPCAGVSSSVTAASSTR